MFIFVKCWCLNFLLRSIMISIENSENKVLFTNIYHFTDMINQLIHLVSCRRKYCSQDFCIVSDEIWKLKFVVICILRRVDLISGRKALINMFFSDMLKFAGFIFDPDNESHFCFYNKSWIICNRFLFIIKFRSKFLFLIRQFTFILNIKLILPYKKLIIYTSKYLFYRNSY